MVSIKFIKILSLDANYICFPRTLELRCKKPRYPKLVTYVIMEKN